MAVRQREPVQDNQKRRAVSGGCTVCGREVAAKGLCGAHYKRAQRGALNAAQPLRKYGRRGRTWQTTGGYIMAYQPGHPNAGTRGTILEHRLVMSRTLGRPLRPGETVHHRNGVRNDNRPSNLELRVGAHGSGVAVVDVKQDFAAAVRARRDRRTARLLRRPRWPGWPPLTLDDVLPREFPITDADLQAALRVRA